MSKKTQKKMNKASVTFRKMAGSSLTMDKIYKMLLDNKEVILDLEHDLKEEIIIGTIKKQYHYAAKRTIDNLDVAGKEEHKFFKFLIKEELGYFLVVSHYEGKYGDFVNLGIILRGLCKNIEFKVIYKVFNNIKMSELKKISCSYDKSEKRNEILGWFHKKETTYYEVQLDKESSDERIITKDNVKTYLDIKESEIDPMAECVNLYVYFKNGKILNLLDVKNTHFDLNELTYSNDLPNVEVFKESVLTIYRNDILKRN